MLFLKALLGLVMLAVFGFLAGFTLKVMLALRSEQSLTRRFIIWLVVAALAVAWIIAVAYVTTGQ